MTSTPAGVRTLFPSSTIRPDTTSGGPATAFPASEVSGASASDMASIVLSMASPLARQPYLPASEGRAQATARVAWRDGAGRLRYLATTCAFPYRSCKWTDRNAFGGDSELQTPAD